MNDLKHQLGTLVQRHGVAAVIEALEPHTASQSLLEHHVRSVTSPRHDCGAHYFLRARPWLIEASPWFKWGGEMQAGGVIVVVREPHSARFEETARALLGGEWLNGGAGS